MSQQKRIAIICANGDLAAAYKTLNIATAGAAMGAEVGIFFTFGGLQVLHRQASAQLPAPPGMEGIGGALAAHQVPSVPELLAMAREMGVKLVACQMTMDVMGVRAEDLIDGIEVGGAATFLAFASDAQVTLSF